MKSPKHHPPVGSPKLKQLAPPAPPASFVFLPVKVTFPPFQIHTTDTLDSTPSKRHLGAPLAGAGSTGTVPSLLLWFPHSAPRKRHLGATLVGGGSTGTVSFSRPQPSPKRIHRLNQGMLDWSVSYCQEKPDLSGTRLLYKKINFYLHICPLSPIPYTLTQRFCKLLPLPH